MSSSFKPLYIVIMILAVVIAAGLGFFAGQTVAPSIKETVVVTQTQRITQVQTVTVTIQQAPTQTTPQPTPTQEQLLTPIIDAARKEGKLVIYSTLDRPSAEPLLSAFKAKYPFIDIQYVELGTIALYNRYVSEKAAGAPTADILWSAAPDLQYLLVLNGSAQPYRITIYDRIPEDAKYKDLAYVSSYTLVAPIYNTEKIPKDLAPKSFADLLKLLTQRKDLFPSRSIAAFNIEASAFGLVFTYYQYKAEPELIRNIMSAAGSIGVVLQPSTGPQIEMVKTGQALISLSLIANYAFREAKTDPRVGAFIPNDLAVLVPRVMFITKEAANPNAAKLFLEFVFSEEGQAKLGGSAEVIVMGNNRDYPQLSLEYLKANVKKLVVVKLGDLIIDEIMRTDVRSNFIAMWKKWLGIG
ncbi:iron ABC transporter substrate-binding protein [Desulfurococcaceae archaeon AG1]|jgi:iron(III) transport system substrate-binding protein|nr:MAG: hypothetical protein DJ555_03950 [Desulfurococcaceae archaeon]GAY26100.1 iron ABC transporter substrate-binding protein [Desulfurococcaceae archaeon AG1]